MEPKAVKLSSLPVPCVQELAKEPMITIPPRYIRPDQEKAIVSDAALMLEIPVIDMQRLSSEESMDSELAKLHSACTDWGFFQKVKAELQDFFNLPVEEKKKLWQYPGEVEGFGQAFVVSQEQKLDWCDIFFLTTRPVSSRKPHLFPNLPLPFRDTLEVYSSELQDLAMAIMEKIAKALNIRYEEMKEYFKDGKQATRMNYYPPCPQPMQAIGLTPHSDAAALTILLQVNDAEGLQIKKDGKWAPVRPLPGAFIVNVGDILEIITNGAYRSIEHRATVNSEKERLSIATFHSPGPGVIRPAPSLITQQTPALFKTVTSEEYWIGLFARELRGKSYLDAMRIEQDEA